MKKIVSILMTAMVALMMVSCGSRNKSVEATATEATDSTEVVDSVVAGTAVVDSVVTE